MGIGFLICLLSAHFISDFLLQPHSITERRYSNDGRVRIRANLTHILWYFIISLLLTSYYLSIWTLSGILVLAAIHFLIDACRTGYGSREPLSRFGVISFLIEQLAHVVSILLVTFAVSLLKPGPSALAGIENKLVTYIANAFSGVTLTEKVMLSMLLFVIGVWGIGSFIRLFFNWRKYRNTGSRLYYAMKTAELDRSADSGTEDGGYIIGILERIFIICAVVFGIKEVIGFVLATKSIARLKKFNDDRFVEDFIIGSLISFISAVAVGVAIRALKIYYVIAP